MMEAVRTSEPMKNSYGTTRSNISEDIINADRRQNPKSHQVDVTLHQYKPNLNNLVKT
jgi:hypothetical protein